MGVEVTDWSPLFDRGDGVWVGVDKNGDIAVGSQEKIKARISTSNPVPLWPLLEKEHHSARELLVSEWHSLDPAGRSEPDELIRAIIVSAVNSGSPYWIERVVEWISAMPRTAADADLLTSQLRMISANRFMPQAIRHRAGKEAKRWSQ
ncbi:hypothetical protein ACFRCG_31030 [Embleya sp. NPDC056575]|uniref:hypothetical protein n=1 Tax=unclassified Embleya TaxID=2699296 RepID=UPI003688ECD9